MAHRLTAHKQRTQRSAQSERFYWLNKNRKHNMNWFPAYKKFFRTPSAETLAAQELEEAKRQLLSAQTALDYAKAMVEYRTRQIDRLKTMLVQEGTK